MGKVFDSYETRKVAALASQIAGEGYTAVGCYYFNHSQIKDLLTYPLARTIAQHLYLFSIYENGSPTTDQYFSASKGFFDGKIAVMCAQNAHQPKDSCVYATCDYDAPESALPAIKVYLAAFRKELIAAGYKVGIYGSGLVCRACKEAGLVEYTFLSQSTGFPGYQEWLPYADIIQGPEIHLLGLDIDTGTTKPTGAGGWKPA